MRRFLAFALFGVLLAAFSAWPAAASHSWGNYHWPRGSNPFTVNLGGNLSGGWPSILGSNTTQGTVAYDWTQSSVLDIPVVGGANVSNPKRCKPVAGRVEVCNASYGFNGWLGIAQIWVSGGHITQGVVKVNDSYFNTSTYNKPNAKRHVLCQEVGHTLGLDHQRSTTSQSCMDDQNGLFESAFASPNQHDYDQLATIYAHLDALTSSSTAPAFHGNGKVKETLYVEDLGNGRAKFTWVFWVDPGAAHGPPF